MTSNFARALPVAIAVAVAGCGTTESAVPAGSLPVVDSPVVDSRDIAPPDSVGVTSPPATSDVGTTTVETPTVVSASFTPFALESIDLAPLSSCERLVGAAFIEDEWMSYTWSEDGTLTVIGDDYVDGADGLCIDGVLDVVEDDPNGNYPTIEISIVDDVVIAHEVSDGESVSLEVTEVELRDSEIIFESLSPDLEAARDMALTHIAAGLDADADAFGATLNDTLMWFEDNSTTTSTRVMEYATDDGFPWGQDHANDSITDYLRDFEPIVTWMNDSDMREESVLALSEVAGTNDVALYRDTARHGGELLFLGTDVGRYALAMTDSGWRIVAM